MTKATMTLGTVTIALGALLGLGGCGGGSDDPMTDPMTGTAGAGGATATTPATSGTTTTPTTTPSGPVLPTQPTSEAAPTGTLDPQLVGSWPVTGVQVYWAGSGVPDWTVSDPLKDALTSALLALSSDGSFTFGPVAGTWTVVPFVAADKALWGTGGRGPDGYARELVLIVNGRVYTRGPIEDPSPPATAPWGLDVSFQISSPQAGTIMVFFQRPSMNTGTGSKR